MVIIDFILEQFSVLSLLFVCYSILRQMYQTASHTERSKGKRIAKKLNNCFPKFWLFEQVSILKKNLKTLQIISIKILASFMRTWNDSGKKIEILQHSTRVLCLSLRTSRFQLVEVDPLLKQRLIQPSFSPRST